MLHTETVKAEDLALIKQLMRDRELENFQLVGGTALSLLIGHRESIDIDLFSQWAFDAEKLSVHLSKAYQAKDLKFIKNGIFCFINDVKVDILTHDYQRIDFIQELEDVRMESLKDLGAMKLNAIVNSGARLKDFVDMYFILEHGPLEQFLEAYEKKYPELNRTMAKAALRYHDDIKPATITFMGTPITLPEMAQRFNEAVLDPHKTFDLTPLPEQSQSKEQNQSRGKGFGYKR